MEQCGFGPYTPYELKTTQIKDKGRNTYIYIQCLFFLFPKNINFLIN